MVFYVYILYSQSSDLYYVGYTKDFLERLHQHNHIGYNTMDDEIDLVNRNGRFRRDTRPCVSNMVIHLFGVETHGRVSPTWLFV